MVATRSGNVLQGHGHVLLITLGLSKWVGGRRGVIFIKVHVQNAKRSLRKLMSQYNDIP